MSRPKIHTTSATRIALRVFRSILELYHQTKSAFAQSGVFDGARHTSAIGQFLALTSNLRFLASLPNLGTGMVGFGVCAKYGRLSGHSSSRYSAAKGSPSKLNIKRNFSLNHSKMANPFDELLGKAEDKAHYEAVGRTTAVVTHLTARRSIA